MTKDFSVSLVQCPCWGRETPPAATTLLAGNLRNKGFKVHLFDSNNDFYHRVSDEHKVRWSQEQYSFWQSEGTLKQFMEEYDSEIEEEAKKIAAAGSQLVGFTVYFTTINFTLEIVRRLKRISPETCIVLGGPSTAEYAGGLELLKNPNIDAIVLREGDETLPEMCSILMEKGRLRSIPGLVFKDGEEVINGGLREPIKSLDALPFPDYSDFDLSRYSLPERLDIFSSRSCVNKCHFCDERNYFGRFRVRSGKSLFEEVQYHLSRFPDIRFFNFSDSVMNGSLGTMREFSELLLQNNINITWGGQGVIRNDMTPELLSLLKRAGCEYISYGVETGSDDVRNSMNKGRFTAEDASRVLKDTHDAGINAYANFMFGFPTEDEDEFQLTLDFLRQNHEWIDGVSPSQSFFVIVPNTHIYENLEKFGVEPDCHHLYWSTLDGTNTYPVRFDRYEKFCKLCLELGLGGVGVIEEKIDKWQLLGTYYRFKNNYREALECYRKDLVKHGYSPESTEHYLECCREGKELDSADPFKGLDSLITHYDKVIQFLKEEMIESNRRHDRQSQMLRRNIKKRDDEIAYLNEQAAQAAVGQ